MSVYSSRRWSINRENAAFLTRLCNMKVKSSLSPHFSAKPRPLSFSPHPLRLNHVREANHVRGVFGGETQAEAAL